MRKTKFIAVLMVLMMVFAAVPVMAADSPVTKDISKVKVTAVNSSGTYTGKVHKVAVKVTYDGKALSPDNYIICSDLKTSSSAVGAYGIKVEICGDGQFGGFTTKAVRYSITKGKTSITSYTAPTSKTLKANTLKTKALTVATLKATAKFGKPYFVKYSGSSYFTVSKAGVVKAKKGTKKGTYTIKVRAKVAGTSNYSGTYKTKTIKVYVK